ncbi:hypothetical protein CHELA40_40205 [Chelatococcus asaccharovorans]|nr:hypothetical protein CHELA17_50252 [Chelatococcus asaccharovorans]CAH1690300.1 hypothetical protein CHELA40_40205 [Chelatococcus asaccharovorans]
MPDPVVSPVIAELRERIQRLDGRAGRARKILPFGLAQVDDRLPGRGLALGCLHEVAGGGNGAVDGAAAALFAAGVAARTRGKVLWCVTRQDLFAPALAQAGLLPARVIFVEAGDEKALLASSASPAATPGSRAVSPASSSPGGTRSISAASTSRTSSPSTRPSPMTWRRSLPMSPADLWQSTPRPTGPRSRTSSSSGGRTCGRRQPRPPRPAPGCLEQTIPWRQADPRLFSHSPFALHRDDRGVALFQSLS